MDNSFSHASHGFVTLHAYAHVRNRSCARLCARLRARLLRQAVSVIGRLVGTMDDASFHELVRVIGTALEVAADEAQALTMVSTLHAIAREGGPRIGPHLATAVPLVLASLHRYEEADEYTEACIKALEAFAFASPAEFAPFLDGVVEACLGFLRQAFSSA